MPATASAVEVSHGQSLRATQNILLSTLSELCWTRGLFEKDAFKPTKMGKMRYHLIQKGKCTDADSMLAWIEEGAMMLIQDDRLEMLTLTISDATCNNPNKFCEAWYFRFASQQLEVVVQSDNDAVSKTQLVGRTQAEVKQMAASLFKTIVSLADALEPIPEEHNISMRLVFKDDPENPGDQPAHFVNAHEAGQGMMSYRKKPEVLDIGQSKTPFHAMALKVKTVVDDGDEEGDPTCQQTYAEPHWENETDEMWRQSDDEGEDDDEDHLKYPCSQKRVVKDEGGDADAAMTSVDDTSSQLPDHLVYSCHEWLAKQSANERITSSVLQMMLPCTPKQADLLVAKMFDDGVIKNAPKRTFKYRTYCVTKPNAPSLSQRSNGTTCSAAPDFVEPPTFAARNTRNRAYAGTRSSSEGTQASPDTAPLVESSPSKTPPLSSCSKTIAAACKNGVERLSEMFGAAAIREPSQRTLRSSASQDVAKSNRQLAVPFVGPRRIHYGPGAVTSSLHTSSKKRASEW
mmetsp:Transcript_38949/g.97527  ORF Transcript_38949/g.97527 Transcript_38949/m.97527 type:complete len:516 (-) Transcript_38949:198-1745(-)